MKIRLKRDHSVAEDVPFLAVCPDKGWSDNYYRFYSKEYWEPVPEEKWGPCSITIHHFFNSFAIDQYGMSLPPGTRVTLVGPSTIKFERKV